MNEWRLLRLRRCARENRRAHRWGIQTAKEAVGGVRFGGEVSVESMRLCEEETGGGKRLTETFQRRLNGERRSWWIGPRRPSGELNLGTREGRGLRSILQSSLSPVRQKKNNNKKTPPAPPSWQETRSGFQCLTRY